MSRAHPQTPKGEDAALVAACVEACWDCAQTCTSCADACLAEDAVSELVHCIRTDLDCADVCGATGRVLSRLSSPDGQLILGMLEACATACGVCAEECARHAAVHEHCRICEGTCRRCEQACRDLIDSLTAPAPAHVD